MRYSKLVFEILAYLNDRKMKESRKQVENNAQVSSSSVYHITQITGVVLHFSTTKKKFVQTFQAFKKNLKFVL